MRQKAEDATPKEDLSWFAQVRQPARGGSQRKRRKARIVQLEAERKERVAKSRKVKRALKLQRKADRDLIKKPELTPFGVLNGRVFGITDRRFAIGTESSGLSLKVCDRDAHFWLSFAMLIGVIVIFFRRHSSLTSDPSNACVNNASSSGLIAIKPKPNWPMHPPHLARARRKGSPPSVTFVSCSVVKT
jgi:hypothetical protein